MYFVRKLPLYTTLRHTGAVQVQVVILNLSTGWMWLIRFTPWPVYAWGYSTPYTFSRKASLIHRIGKSLAPAAKWTLIPQSPSPYHFQNWRILISRSGLVEGHKMWHCAVLLDLTPSPGFTTDFRLCVLEIMDPSVCVSCICLYNHHFWIQRLEVGREASSLSAKLLHPLRVLITTAVSGIRAVRNKTRKCN
jgi:hypothetical protein